MKVRKIIALFIVCVMCLGFGGCGEQTNVSSTQPNLQQETEQSELDLIKNNVDTYKQYLIIHDVKIDDYTHTFPDKYYVEGQIKNNGSKSIRYLYVTIYYLDNNNEPISEDTTQSFALDYSDFIKPNYESDFVFEVPKEILNSWSKKYNVEIAGIEFE